MVRQVSRFLVLVALIALTACTPRLLDDKAAAVLVVRNVTVDTSAIEGVKGRKMAFDMPPEQIAADITAALREKLGAVPSGNGDVLVKVQTVRLMSRLQEYALGGASFVKGEITVTDVATGREVVPPTKITGASQRLRIGGIIGAVVAPTAKKDYEQTLKGFAQNVLIRLSPRHDVKVIRRVVPAGSAAAAVPANP
jgi:hypothetical protein